jgi:hypothetical protein
MKKRNGVIEVAENASQSEMAKLKIMRNLRRKKIENETEWKSVTKIIISVSKAAWRSGEIMAYEISKAYRNGRRQWHQWQNGRNNAVSGENRVAGMAAWQYRNRKAMAQREKKENISIIEENEGNRENGK